MFDSSPTATSTWSVRFFRSNLTSHSAWLVEKDISRLQPHEIEAFVNEPSKKKGDLLEAYKIAQTPQKWLEKRALEEAMAVDEDANSEDAEADDVDQLESENDKKATAKKRKRDAESTSTKSKKTAKKDTDTTSSKKKAGGKKGAKSKATVESEDEGEHGRSASGAENAGPSRKESPPAAKKLKRDKEAEGEDGMSPASILSSH